MGKCLPMFFPGLLALLLLVNSCQHSMDVPFPLPQNPQLLVRTQYGELIHSWMPHWTQNAPETMQSALPSLQAMLRSADFGPTDSVAIAWYAISPDVWSPILCGEQGHSFRWRTERTPTDLATSTYRQFPVQTWRLDLEVPIYGSQRFGQPILALRRSLLQDALIADGLPRSLPQYVWRSAGVGEKPYAYGGQPRAEASVFQFMSEDDKDQIFGRLMPIADAWLAQWPDGPSAGFALVTTLPGAGPDTILAGWWPDHKAHFIWIPDREHAMAEIWRNRREQYGLLGTVRHQGMMMWQLLDHSWEEVSSTLGWPPLRNPWLVELPGGWLLTGLRADAERWIDYLLAGKTLANERTEQGIPENIVGWFDAATSWYRHSQALLGPVLPKGDGWWLTHSSKHYALRPMANPDQGPDLGWQVTKLTWPLRYWQTLDFGWIVADSFGLHAFDFLGQRLWTIPVNGPLKAPVLELHENGREYLVFHTPEAFYLIDRTGSLQPGFPYRLPSGIISGSAVVAGTDGRLRIFLQDDQGQVYGFRTDLVPVRGWPQKWSTQPLRGALKTDTTDVLLALGPDQWHGYTPNGDLMWSRPSAGRWDRMYLAGDRLYGLLESGDLGYLNAEGTWVQLRSSVRKVDWSSNWLLGADSRAVFLSICRPTFRVRASLPDAYSQLVIAAQGDEVFFGASRGSYWTIHHLDRGILPGMPIPSRRQPLIYLFEDRLWILSDQGDKIAAYYWPYLGG